MMFDFGCTNYVAMQFTPTKTAPEGAVFGQSVFGLFARVTTGKT